MATLRPLPDPGLPWSNNATGRPMQTFAEYMQRLDASINAPTSKTVNTTYNLATASGTVDLTGFGFDPTSVEMNYAINAGSCGGVGFASSDGSQGCSSTTTDAGTVWVRQTAVCVFVSNAAGTNFQFAAVSFITDGIRFTWTKGGLPVGTLGLTVLGCR